MMDLTRFLIVVLICSSVNTIHAQFIVKGTVQDPEGNGLPGVEISVANTTYGIISDYDGQYFLELNSSEKYPIRFHALGMYDTTVVILPESKFTVLNITLLEQVTELESVEVISKKN